MLLALIWDTASGSSQLLWRLGRWIPPGTQWGFNYEGDRAWVWAEAHVELDALVDEARSATR